MVDTIAPLPRLNDARLVEPWAHRLVTELSRRLQSYGVAINSTPAASSEHTHVFHEELGSGSSGAVWTFANAHVSGSERVRMNNIPLRRVTSGAGVNEYTIDVPTYTITLWASKGTGDFLEVDYNTASATTHAHIFAEVLGAGASGAVWNLLNIPIVGSDTLRMNNLPLRRVTSGAGVNEYTISGKTVTLWSSKLATDHLEADYIT